MFRCLLATLGKDAPGVNAALRSVTRLALRRGMEVYAAKRGFPGILSGKFHKMKEPDVGFILGKGGSILGSADFRFTQGDTETPRRLAEVLRKFDLVVACGGLGCFSILNHIYSTCKISPTTTMVIPASVENEFLNPLENGTNSNEVHAESVGADTACNVAIEAIDRLREQGFHNRTVFLIQCVGAKSNYLPIQIGMACGAHRIYLPRYPLLSDDARSEIKKLFGENFDPNRVDSRELVTWMNKMFEESKKPYLVVLIASGVPMVSVSGSNRDEGLREDYEDIVTTTAPLELTSLRVVDDLAMHFTGDSKVQVRFVLLDDLQRGGAPMVRDRCLGSLYGEAAVEEFLALVNTQDVKKRGNLNLLGISSTSRVAWNCYTRQEVTPLFQGPNPRAGGLDPLPFFRQMRGSVSGYRPMAWV